MADKITVQQKFNATIAILEGATPEIEFSVADAIEFLTDRAEKAKSKPRAHKVNEEVVEFRNAVATFMSEQESAMVAKDVAEALGVSTQKASAALRWLVGEGILTATDGEGRAPKQYAMAR